MVDIKLELVDIHQFTCFKPNITPVTIVYGYQIPDPVNRRTDDKIVKRKRTKGQTTIDKTLDIKLKIE